MLVTGVASGGDPGHGAAEPASQHEHTSTALHLPPTVP